MGRTTGPWNSVETAILPLLPPKLQKAADGWLRRTAGNWTAVQEIRLRAGQPLCIVHRGTDSLLGPETEVTPDDLTRTLSLVSDCSYYALESEFANGYITIPGGHRVGLAGKVAVWPGGIVKIREVSAMNFRVARAIRGSANRLVRHLTNGSGRLCSTLVISPPGCGKTTLLRDLCRIASEGLADAGILPAQVGIVDERSEIAACHMGVPQHDLGPRVDVLDRCPKALGVFMLLRSMGPGVVATDEVSGEEDARAVSAAIAAGATVLATCHGRDVADVKRNPRSSHLIAGGDFRKVVVLSGRKGPGTLEYVGEPQ